MGTDSRMTHLRTVELADLAEGRIDAADMARHEAHLAGCAECAAELAHVERLLAVMRADRTPEPLASVVARAVDLFAPARPEPFRERVRAWLAGLEAVAGRLVFDSLREPSFAAARGTVTSRRLRYETADLELDLAIEHQGGRLALTGQVSDLRGDEVQAASGSRFLVVSRDDTLAAGEADAIGEFSATVEDRPGLAILVTAGGRALSCALPLPAAGSMAVADDDG